MASIWKGLIDKGWKGSSPVVWSAELGIKEQNGEKYTSPSLRGLPDLIQSRIKKNIQTQLVTYLRKHQKK